jgi:hypothetical protein
MAALTTARADRANSRAPLAEAERLAALRRYEILDTPPDGAFERLTAIAARHFRVPISIITLVDEDRIWFKSVRGVEGVREIGRDPGLCASAVLQDEVWVVQHADLDPCTLRIRSWQDRSASGSTRARH